MSNHPTPIDISQMPELLDLVKEVEATKTPRELRRDNKPVAVLTPILEHEAEWDKIKATFGKPRQNFRYIYGWRSRLYSEARTLCRA